MWQTITVIQKNKNKNKTKNQQKNLLAGLGSSQV
jgi:hypothetical protein